jgi:hypothetical protein
VTTTHPARATPLHQRSLEIAIAANFSARPLNASLALWLERLRILSIPRFAPYDSVIQQLLDDSGAILESAARRQPGTVFLIITCPASPAVKLDEGLAAAEERLTVGIKGLPNVDFVG